MCYYIQVNLNVDYQFQRTTIVVTDISESTKEFKKERTTSLPFHDNWICVTKQQLTDLKNDCSEIAVSFNSDGKIVDVYDCDEISFGSCSSSDSSIDNLYLADAVAEFFNEIENEDDISC